MEIIEFIGATLAYIALNAYIYYVIEIKDMTLASLNYRPWTCRTCLTFWTGIWISTVAAFGGAWTFAITMASIRSFRVLPYFAESGLLVAVLVRLSTISETDTLPVVIPSIRFLLFFIYATISES